MKKLVSDSAQALLEKAQVCIDIAQDQQGLANELHEVATRQTDNADKQQKIALQQHINADRLEDKASRLDELGHSLEGKAAEMLGETLISPFPKGGKFAINRR
jgi:hypothetical protein